MANVIARDNQIQGCNRCGKTIARLTSQRTGNQYNVEIRSAIEGAGLYRNVRVRNNDFHTCNPADVAQYRAAHPLTPATNYSTLVAFFAKATANFAVKNHGKLPRLSITLNIANREVEIKQNLKKGVLYVTDGGPFGANEYYGKIELRSGDFFKGRAYRDAIGLLLGEFAANPAKVAAQYGHFTGKCSFCSRKLEDERSVSVGYGPICAEHYGLPWGAKTNGAIVDDEKLEDEMNEMFAKAERASERAAYEAEMEEELRAEALADRKLDYDAMIQSHH